MATLPNNTMDNDFKIFKSQRSCLNVFDLPYNLRCEYVQTSADCDTRKNLVNYIIVVCCHLKIESNTKETMIMAFLVLITFLLILTIAVVADNFFAPTLKVIARMMHINEHLAGVTLLAFGNSSANLFSNITAGGRTSPVFANAMSSGLFVFMVSGGVICFLIPFKLNPHAVVRDLLFFISGALLVDHYLRRNNQVEFVEATYLISFYGFYIIVIAVDHLLLKKAIYDLSHVLDEMKQRLERDHKAEAVIKNELTEMMKEAGIEMKVRRSRYWHHREIELEVVDEDLTRDVLHVPNTSPNRNLFSDFFEEVRPIEPIDWQAANIITKLFMLVRAPIYLFCLLYIPKVDVELNKHGWTKLLNCIHIVTMPSITACILTSFFVKKNEFWLFYMNPYFLVYPLPITIPLAMINFCFSRTDLPPKHHFVFALMSIISSIVVIFVCAAEISQITELLCTVMKYSGDFMGATIGALASSIGDLVVNIAMAMHGYGQMAFAAAVGGPFFNVVFVIGITYLLDMVEEGDTVVDTIIGNYGDTAFIFLLLALSTTLLWVMFLDFKARRSVGIYSILVYIIFLLMAILIEAEIISSWAPDVVLKFPCV